MRQTEVWFNPLSGRFVTDVQIDENIFLEVTTTERYPVLDCIVHGYEGQNGGVFQSEV
jgi:hypothetical protein